MGKVYEDGLDELLQEWVREQPMFFVATAPLAADGRVNVSPRGHDCLTVLDPWRLAWVDYTGSGVETIAHLRENARITVMWCSFGPSPKILRVHGRGSVHLPGTPVYDDDVVARHPAHPSTRAVVLVDAERVSDSCGYGVPLMAVTGERDLLRRNAERRGPEGLVAYRLEKNARSLDDLPGLDPE